MQTDSSFFTFLVPRNWDIRMPGTLSKSKPCDKCRRSSQTTTRTSVELPKKARCFFQKNRWIWLGKKPVASASNEKGRWHGVVCRACSRSPGPASPPTVTPCHHGARWPVQDTGFSCTGWQGWEGFGLGPCKTNPIQLWGERDIEKDVKLLHCAWGFYFQRNWTEMKKKK